MVQGQAFADVNTQIYENIADSLSNKEKNVRSAAIKIITNNGHGSGTYVTINEFHVVLTANHVTDDAIGTKYFLLDGDEITTGILVFKNSEIDIAAIHISPMKNRTPIKFIKNRTVSDIGTDITYSGFPASHSLLTFRGSIVGYETSVTGRKIILIHTYAWFGCSGSGIYDLKGRLIGILWGVSREFHRGDVIVEDIAWVTPAAYINETEIIRSITEIQNTK